MPSNASAGVAPSFRLGSVQWGDLRRMDPISESWGFDRGLPVDRHYIEAFLAQHRSDIRGRCVEVMSADYTRQFGGDQVTGLDVVDIDAGNPRATIVGDLLESGTLREEHYDCFVLTQTLPVVYDGRTLVRNAYSALKPGGALLVTAPTLCRYSPHPHDYWRLTDRAMERLLREHTHGEQVEVRMYGNLVASIAFLAGLASEELTRSELDLVDERFPVIVAGRVRKPSR